MQPTSEQLIRGVVAVLTERIEPAVAGDAWAASEVRSIGAVLTLVAGRLDHEEAVRGQDQAELAALLEQLTAAGIAVDLPQTGPGGDGHSAMLAALEAALPQVHDGDHPGEVAAVRRYLKQAATRERLIYGPLSGRRLY